VELFGELLGQRRQVYRLALHGEPACIQPGQVEQVGRELRQPHDLLAHGG